MHVAGLRWEWQWRRAATATTLALVAAAAFADRGAGQTTDGGRTVEGDSPEVLAERVAADAWDRFTTRVTVRRQWASATGESQAVETQHSAAVGRTAGGNTDGGAAEISEYVLERQKVGRGWKTSITVVPRAKPMVHTRLGTASLTEPSTISRVEDSEDGSAPRFFDSTGTELLPRSSSAWRRLVRGAAGRTDLGALDATLVEQTATMMVPRRAEGRAWVRSFVLTPHHAAARRQAAQRSLGRRAGWVRGYGQYLQRAGGKQVEVLLDEHNGVPMETNVVEDGRLRSHTTFRYERAASGALVKRGVRIEHAPPPTPGSDASSSSPAAHMVTDITYSQIRLNVAGPEQPKGGR
jgi:hypothetical protein